LSAPPRRTVFYAVLTLALVAAAAWLAWNTRPPDDRTRLAIAEKLQLLNELGARWDIAMLAAKTAPAQAVQTERTLVPVIQRALADLQQLSAVASSAALATNLPGLVSAIEDRAQLGTRVASMASALAATLETEVAPAMSTVPAGNPAATRATELARAELLAYWGEPGDRRRMQAEAALAQLPADHPLHSHARAVLGGKPELESAITRFALSPAGPRLLAVSAAFSAEVEGEIERQQLFRTYLLFYSAALLVLLGWIASRLIASYQVIGRINGALQAANENLEYKVESRTRELSDALSDLKASEAQLIQSEKMSSLGQMVAGIAHEINTPIAYVKNSLGSVDRRLDALNRLTTECEKLLAMLGAGDFEEAALDLQLAELSAAADELGGSARVGELGGLVKDGLYGVDQIGRIVSHLRDFSRLDRGEVQQFDLHEGIDSTLLLARHLLKAVRVEKRFNTDGHLLGSPSQINQVLLNLITNAAQAIGPEGGVIILATSGSASELVLDVTDSGSGIAPEVLSRIFDPFFTTKAVGQGTGLGLSISYKIVTQHGGRIEVRSTPGLGTRFRIRLPRTGAPSAAASTGPLTGPITAPITVPRPAPATPGSSPVLASGVRP